MRQPDRTRLIGPKYAFSFIMSVIRMPLLFLVPVYAIYRYVLNGVLKKGFDFSQNDLIILGFLAVIWFFLFVIGKPLEKQQANLRNERDFDENGLSKKYNSYQKLSRSEREAIDKQRLADVERIIGTGTLKKITKHGSENPDKDLENLMGLKKVKHEIAELSARMEFDKRAAAKHKKTMRISSMHMCFMGPPGTGKTTCAKIMTGFLYKYGYIKHNKYIETDGNFLRGQTQGETSEKTSLLLSMAKGKVLFIDEAYALFSGVDAQEATATIIKAMEDDRDSFVLILAGYENEMKRLIESNPGFFSRIGHILYFGNYTNAELTDIFSFMANQHNFFVPAETRERFEKRIVREKTKQNFGNARTCRNILDESISKHAYNLKHGVLKKDKMFTICPEDIVLQKEDFYGSNKA